MSITHAKNLFQGVYDKLCWRRFLSRGTPDIYTPPAREPTPPKPIINPDKNRARRDIGDAGYGDRDSTMQRIGNEMVEVITRASLAEISITMEGGCPGTAVWLAGADIEDLPPHAKRLASHWGVGRMKALLPLARAA